MVTLITQRELKTEFNTVDSLEQDYITYFEKFNLNLVSVPNNTHNLDFYLNLPIKRIILSGGNDSENRNLVETALLNFAIKNKIPVLGICKGMQFINLHFNGNLINIPNRMHVSINHDVNLLNSEIIQLLQKQKINTNSFHNIGVNKDTISSKLISFAESREVVEGIFHKYLPIAGIQWHPERKNNDPESNQKIISAFINNRLFWRQRS